MTAEQLKQIIEYAADYAYNMGFTNASEDDAEYMAPEILNAEVLLSLQDEYPNIELLNSIPS